MSTLLKPMSVDDFLVWEELQDLRYEFDGVAAEAMTGGTQAHARVQANLIGALHARLRGGLCFVLGSELKIRTQTTIRYPDAMVVCAPGDDKATWTNAPTVLFEILSPSSARKDLGVKNAEYQTLPSLRRYVVLHQDVVAAEVFFRDDEGEFAHEFVAAGGALRMPEIGVELPIAVCYEGLALS
jgi:Uma2 family endonuclease